MLYCRHQSKSPVKKQTRHWLSFSQRRRWCDDQAGCNFISKAGLFASWGYSVGTTIPITIFQLHSSTKFHKAKSISKASVLGSLADVAKPMFAINAKKDFQQPLYFDPFLFSNPRKRKILWAHLLPDQALPRQIACLKLPSRACPGMGNRAVGNGLEAAEGIL